MKQKIYISSTFLDLKEYRSLIKSLFENQLANAIELCKIMERMWDDGSQTPFVDECVREVKASDIYILILGNKVGSFPPGESRTYTEIELDTAIIAQKKIFCFHYKDFDHNEIDNAQKHKEVLSKFAGKPTHVFSNPSELKADLLECLLPHISSSIQTKNRISQSVYGSLNELPDTYLGREDEIKLIGDYFDQMEISSSREVCVVGEGGLGKTSLITKYLLEYQYKYKYYIFLFCESGIIPELEKMAMLRLPNYDKLHEKERIGEMVTYLNNLVLEDRGIILFDNVNVEAHWQDFKKYYGLITWDKLVSSRTKFLTKHEIDLQPLPEHQALDLFYTYYSHEDRPSTERIVKQLLSGMFYNTLLIEIFAKVLDQHYGLFDEGMVIFIEKFKEKGLFSSIENDYTLETKYSKNIHKYDVDKVSEILSVMYDVSGLTPDQKIILQALALFPTSKHKIATVIDIFNPLDKVAFYNQLKTLSAWIIIDNTHFSMKDLVQEMLLHSCEGEFNNLQDEILHTLTDKIDESITDVPKIIQIYFPIAHGVLKNAFRVSPNMTPVMFDLAEDINYFEKNVLTGGSDAESKYHNFKLYIETLEEGKGHLVHLLNIYETFVDICKSLGKYDEAIEYQKWIVEIEKKDNKDLKHYASTLKKLISIYRLKFD